MPKLQKLTKSTSTPTSHAWLLGLLILAVGGWSCGESEPMNRSMEVTATAYNSTSDQTNEQPDLTAFGDKLEPGMKAIAVSRDLIAEGLDHGTEVRIDGLPGTYLVLDKMAARWRKKIDIYFGLDREAALEWGKRKVTIHWHDPEAAQGSSKEESP